MKPRIPMTTALAVLLASTCTGNAFAQDRSAPKPESREQALAEARADLARAARRVAELSRQRALHRQDLMRRPVLGVLLAPDDKSGVRIAGVTPGSGAAQAGLKAGDRILGVDGRQVLGDSGELRVRNLRKLLGDLEADKAAKIGYVRDGRTATASVTPRIDQRVYIWNDANGSLVKADGNVAVRRDKQGRLTVTADRLEGELPGIASEIRKEIIRIGPLDVCKGDACSMPALLSAFRWNGLNLATVDARLGRYFGTDHGVLVLSNGDLDGLQAGDVIQRIEGKPVASPREAMAALRGRPEGAKVAIEYLRDRKPGKTQVAVPELMPLPIPPMPPRPPAPPAAPKAPPPPAPPAPPLAWIPA